MSSLGAMLRTLTRRSWPGSSSQESDAAASLSDVRVSGNQSPSRRAAHATTPAVWSDVAVGPDAGSAGPGPGSGVSDRVTAGVASVES